MLLSVRFKHYNATWVTLRIPDVKIVNRLEQLKCDTETTSNGTFDIAGIKAFLYSARNVFLLLGIREQNVTFVLTAVLWEFSQLVLDLSSGRTFFLVWCLRNIERLFVNLEWQTAGHYGEEVEIICDMCCGGKCLEQEFWGPQDVWTPVMRTLFLALREMKFLWSIKHLLILQKSLDYV